MKIITHIGRVRD